MKRQYDKEMQVTWKSKEDSRTRRYCKTVKALHSSSNRLNYSPAPSYNLMDKYV